MAVGDGAVPEVVGVGATTGGGGTTGSVTGPAGSGVAGGSDTEPAVGVGSSVALVEVEPAVGADDGSLLSLPSLQAPARASTRVAAAAAANRLTT
ncbi:hypothetical protein ASE19_05760 [Nocardioides sp. Root79]|nr:hypothetical protein ASE19_05760 [Nocardioides sp. Root79]KRC73697.1 hypothetical protein ASE20_03455 [Nocardioides sp. Root240]